MYYIIKPIRESRGNLEAVRIRDAKKWQFVMCRLSLVKQGETAWDVDSEGLGLSPRPSFKEQSGHSHSWLHACVGPTEALCRQDLPQDSKPALHIATPVPALQIQKQTRKCSETCLRSCCLGAGRNLVHPRTLSTAL